MDRFIGATLPYGNWKDLHWGEAVSVGGLFHIRSSLLGHLREYALHELRIPVNAAGLHQMLDLER